MHARRRRWTSPASATAGQARARRDHDRVGLGRVVEDRRPLSTGSRTPTIRVRRTEAVVEEASEDSFPASDPPPFTSASGG